MVRAAKPESGKQLEQACANVARDLGLVVQQQVKVGRRIWGPQRQIDLVVTDQTTRRSLGIECKYQKVKGTTEEKIPATISDIEAWPTTGSSALRAKDSVATCGRTWFRREKLSS